MRLDIEVGWSALAWDLAFTFTQCALPFFRWMLQLFVHFRLPSLGCVQLPKARKTLRNLLFGFRQASILSPTSRYSVWPCLSFRWLLMGLGLCISSFITSFLHSHFRSFRMLMVRLSWVFASLHLSLRSFLQVVVTALLLHCPSPTSRYRIKPLCFHFCIRTSSTTKKPVDKASWYRLLQQSILCCPPSSIQARAGFRRFPLLVWAWLSLLVRFGLVSVTLHYVIEKNRLLHSTVWEHCGIGILRFRRWSTLWIASHLFVHFRFTFLSTLFRGFNTRALWLVSCFELRAISTQRCRLGWALFNTRPVSGISWVCTRYRIPLLHPPT